MVVVRFRCPNCKKDTALWRSVELSGWQAIAPDLNHTKLEREAHWETARHDGLFGCGECSWEGRDLERVSEVDLEPLPVVHKRQEALPV